MKSFRSKLQSILVAAMFVASLTLTGTIVLAESNDGLAGPDARPSTRPAKGSMSGERQGKRGKREPLKRLLQGIELTDDQKAQMETVKTEIREQAKAFHDKNKDAIQQLRSEFKAAKEAGDKEKLTELRDQRKALFKDAPKPENIADRVRAILNEDQQKTFDANLEEMKKRIKDRASKGPRGNREGKGPRGKHKGTDGDTGDGNTNNDQLDM